MVGTPRWGRAAGERMAGWAPIAFDSAGTHLKTEADRGIPSTGPRLWRTSVPLAGGRGSIARWERRDIIQNVGNDRYLEGSRGHRAVMSAGAVDGTYGQRLNAIDWGLLYAARDGYVMFEDVRAQWQAADFDYVLLDSRTGFTDVGGIRTRHLPDAVVSLFRPDDQSLGGTAQMAEAIRAEVPTPRRANDIEQHFVMAGIPDADDEHGHLARRRRVFVDRLGIPRHDRLTEIRHYSSMDLLHAADLHHGTAGDETYEIVPGTHAEDSGQKCRRP